MAQAAEHAKQDGGKREELELKADDIRLNIQAVKGEGESVSVPVPVLVMVVGGQ